MNSKFTDEQIKAYAAQFREGDAIWSGGKWCEIVESVDFDGHFLVRPDGPKNGYYVRNLNGGVIGGFSTMFNKYRVTTLEHYELQGGEKIVWLGEGGATRTFGKSYTVNNEKMYTDDSGTGGWVVISENWGIIPRYEQVKSEEKEDDGMNIKMVDKANYTGKFKFGSKVQVVATTEEEFEWDCHSEHFGKTGIVIEIDESSNHYPYLVRFDTGEEDDFNEATLELVNDAKSNNDALDALRYSVDKINRPASSHYHANNNGNDVWNFADDNLSSERVKGFHQVNALKYIARYEKKHDTAEKRIEDLEKAKVSIDKLIELERK